MKPTTFFSAICFAVLAAVNVQAQSSYKDTLIANVKKAQDKTESLDNVSDGVDSSNAMTSGSQILKGLYEIADLVDAATDGTCDIPADICPPNGGPPGGADIISAVDAFSSEYQDLIDSIGQRHNELSKAGYEGLIHRALEHSEASYKSFEDGLYDTLPCQKSNIDDDALDLNGKFKEVISMYKGQPSVGGSKSSSGASSSTDSAKGKLKKILKEGGGEDAVKSVLHFRRLR